MRSSAFTTRRCASMAWWRGRWQRGGRRHAPLRRSSVANKSSRAAADGRAELLLLLLTQRHRARIQSVQLTARLLASSSADLAPW